MGTLEDIINGVINKTYIIPEEYNVLLDNIKKAESGILHYNSKETDITNGYGIYRQRHPNALVFNYIDNISKPFTKLPSSKWNNKQLLKSLNSVINQDIDRYLSYLFYKEYLAGAKLELFDKDHVVLVANLYTNSPKGAWMSIQEGLRDMQKDGVLNIKLSDLPIVDGVFGGKTARALTLLKEIKTETVYEKVLINKLFKKSVLLAMKSYYADITSNNPDKFVGYLKGWDNRIEDLEHN